MDTLTDTFERVQEELGDGDEGLDVEYHVRSPIAHAVLPL